MNHLNKTAETNFLQKISVFVTAIAFVVGGFFIPSVALAAVTIMPASGGTNISIDTTSASGGNSIYTTLSGPTITENVAGDITVGTHTITLPPGWKFDTSLTVRVNGSNGPGIFVPKNQTAVVTDNTLTFTITSASTQAGSLSFISDLDGNSIKIIPTNTSVGTGNMTYSGAGIAGVDGSTNFGTLSTVAGAPIRVKIENSATGGMEIDTSTVQSGTTLTTYSNTRDQFGNFVANVTSTWSLVSPTGVVNGDLVPSGDTKSALFTGNLVGTAIIQAVSSFTDITGVVTVTPGSVSATNSTIGVSVGTAVVNSGTNPITITVITKDTAGNLISGKNVVVSATGSINSINPVSALTDANGVATFTISSTKAEQKIISAKIEGNPIDASQNKTITFTHDVASQLSVTQQPSDTATAGVIFTQQPVINVLDSFGNLVTNSSVIITATKHSDANLDVLKGTLTTTASEGVATFSGLKYEKATTISIDFSSGSLTPVTSSSIAVSPAFPANITFQTPPTSSQGSTVDNALTGQPVVSIKDTFGNNVANGTTVTLTKAVGSGALQGILTQTTTNGVATFSSVGYNKVDQFSITATAGGVLITSDSIGPLGAGVIANFSISATSPQIAGTPFTLSVNTAVDKFTNPTNGTIMMSGGSTAPNGTNEPTYNPITVVNGVGTAQITLVNATPTTLTGTSGSVSRNTSAIIVNPAVASQITLTSDKTAINANGTDIATVTAQLKDAFGNNNLTSGVNIAFSAPRGTVVTSPVLTNGSGQAMTTFNSGTDRNSGNVIITASSTGLVSGIKTITFNDVTAPSAPIITAPIIITYTNASNYTITGTAEANSLVQIYRGVNVVASYQLSGGVTSFSISTPLVLNTANNFTATAKDVANNESSSASVSIINEDNINPSIISYTLDNSVISPNTSSGIKDTASFNLAFSEEVNTTMDIVNSSGNLIKAIYSSSAVTNPGAKTWDGKNTASVYVVDGVYTIKIVLTDKAGNSITDTIKTITVDNTAPTVALTYGVNPAKAGSEIVTATYSEPVVGTPQISIDQPGSTDIANVAMTATADSKVWIYQYIVSIANGGTYIDGTAMVSLSPVTDVAGNVAGVPTGNSFTIDTTPPIASITSPSADSVVKNVNGDVSLAFNSTGGSVCAYKIDGGSYTTLANCTSPKTITLTDGRKSVVLKVTDVAGNFTESSAVSFVVDTNNTLTVGTTGADFTTIQGVVTKATAGDTISVAAGTYQENISIDNKQNVTIQGVGDTTVIEPASGIGFAVKDSNSVTIKNLKIHTTGTDAHGIWVAGIPNGGTAVTGLTIQDTAIVVDGYSTGIYAEQVSTVPHSGWLIGGSGHGNSIIINPGTGVTGDGMDLHDVSASTVSYNTITLNTPTDSTNVLWTSELSNLTGLVFSNNIVSGSSGSEVAFIPNFILTGNSSTISTVTISGNTFSNWGLRALRIGDGATSVTVSGNKFLVGSVVETLKNQDAGQVNAEANYWGSSTGPATNAVVGNVDYRPWCTENTCMLVDNTTPTVSISSTANSPTNLISIPVVIHFSENVLNFFADDVTVTSGNKGVLSGSGADYTINIIPTATDVTVKINANTAWNGSGNYNTESNTLTRTYDNVIPTLSTVTIVSNNTNTTLAKVGNTVTLAFVASENLTSKPIVTIATHAIDAGNVVQGSDAKHWTAIYIMASGDTEGIVPFTINFSDIATNAGTQVSTKTGGNDVTFDKIAPVVAITAPTVDSRVNASKVIKFTDSDSTTPQCSINNSTWVTCVSDTTTLNNVTGFSALADGNFTLYFRDTDMAGNVGTTQVALVKDTTAPSITNKTPSANTVGVDPISNIIVIFNEDVVITNAEVTLQKGSNTPVGTVVDFVSGNKTATINPSTNLENNSKYTVTLTGVTDTVGNSLPTTSWSFTTSASYSMTLTTGWNLISLPVVPTNTNASAVLGATLNDATKIETVWKYDPIAGTWGAYHPGNSDTSSFSTMTAGEGYWINYLPSTNGIISGIGNLFQEGNSTPPQKTLAAGWNLIGYYQLENITNTTATHALSTVSGQWTQLRTYNNIDKQFQAVTSSDLMKPGEGYWIFMKSSSFAPYLYGPGDTD